jgi:hypothetical protein
MRERVDGELRQLAAMAAQPPDVDPPDLNRLPEPVRRYVAYTGLDRQPLARYARIRFTGEVRLPQTGGRERVDAATPWMAMTGSQTMALSKAGLGYVWDTRWTNPRFAVDVRDRYVNGQTHIWAVRDDGTVLIDEGDEAMAATYLIRFFAEGHPGPGHADAPGRTCTGRRWTPAARAPMCATARSAPACCAASTPRAR